MTIMQRASDMAEELSKAKASVKAQADPFAEHWMKCALYGDSTKDLSSWINTLSNILVIVNETLVKPSGRKLKKDYIRDNFLLGSLNDAHDVSRLMAKLEIAGLPDLALKGVYVDRDKVLSDYLAMCEELLPILASHNDMKKSDFAEIVRRHV